MEEGGKEEEKGEGRGREENEGRRDEGEERRRKEGKKIINKKERSGFCVGVRRRPTYTPV